MQFVVDTVGEVDLPDGKTVKGVILTTPDGATPEQEVCAMRAAARLWSERVTIHSENSELAALIHYAKTVKEGAHPTGGNYVADVLDALASYAWIAGEGTDEEFSAAENLVDAATALRNRVDDVLSGVAA